MVLVVEDHAETQYVLLRVLKREKYEAVGAACGESALNLLQTLTPRLIILDCHMPGMDGLAVLRRLRESTRLRDTPVIMFSAADVGEERQALELGARVFVRKGSLNWTHLLSAVKQHIGPPTPRGRA